jgi:hypothetical protein
MPFYADDTHIKKPLFVSATGCCTTIKGLYHHRYVESDWTATTCRILDVVPFVRICKDRAPDKSCF